jgi:hypothetical protein
MDLERLGGGGGGADLGMAGISGTAAVALCTDWDDDGDDAVKGSCGCGCGCGILASRGAATDAELALADSEASCTIEAATEALRFEVRLF